MKNCVYLKNKVTRVLPTTFYLHNVCTNILQFIQTTKFQSLLTETSFRWQTKIQKHHKKILSWINVPSAPDGYLVWVAWEVESPAALGLGLDTRTDKSVRSEYQTCKMAITNNIKIRHLPSIDRQHRFYRSDTTKWTMDGSKLHNTHTYTRTFRPTYIRILFRKEVYCKPWTIAESPIKPWTMKPSILNAI